MSALGSFLLAWCRRGGRRDKPAASLPFPGALLVGLLGAGEFSAALALCRQFPNRDQAGEALVALATDGRLHGPRRRLLHPGLRCP